MKKLLKNILLNVLSARGYIALMEKRNKTTEPGFKLIGKDTFLGLLAKKRNLFFVQIGANDGVKNDPIYPFIKKYHWRGILVEPLPDFFERLKANYKEETQLTFENVGIADEKAELNFYYLPPQYNEPDWLQQIGSFDRAAIEFNLNGMSDLNSKIEVKKIPVIPLPDLLKKTNGESIDLLVIDAEGFEYKILSQLDKLTNRVEHIL
jgi:FkbM family methyltransferase